MAEQEDYQRGRADRERELARMDPADRQRIFDVYQPVDPELFQRTAPQWNCVDFPGEGMHYVGSAGSCLWCGMTRDQIAQEHAAREARRVNCQHHHNGPLPCPDQTDDSH